MAKPPVVLLGGLNLVRALGMAGLRVVVASPDPGASVLASRYTAERLMLPPLEQRAAVLDVLLRAGERLASESGRSIPLYYGDDDYLSLIEQHRGALGEHYRMILNDPEVAQALIDKDRFGELAASHGLPVPRSLAWEELQDWDAPVLVKPKVKLAFERSPVYLRLLGAAGKARIFERGADVAAHAVARQLRAALLFQEYVAGDDCDLWSFHGYADERGDLLAWFVGHKLRTYPALTGVSTYLELVHDDRLATLGHELARRVPLKGVFKMDLKRDRRTGRWHLLEVNARFNLWHYLAAQNGLNLTKVAYDYLVEGERPATHAYGTQYRWLSLRADYRAFRDLAARGELGAGAWLASILRGPKVHDLFSWSDPAPFLRHLLHRAKRLPRLPVKLWRWLSAA